MKIDKIFFGASSFVQQNLNVKEIKNDESQNNKLEKQPKQDEFVKEDENEDPVIKLHAEQERQRKEFERLANKPQTFKK